MRKCLHKHIARAVAITTAFTSFACIGSKSFEDYTTNKDTAIITAATARQVENLNRGLVAVNTGNGVFLSWRYLGTDNTSLAFNLYRNGTKINSTPITDSTNYLDRQGNSSSKYSVEAVLNNERKDISSSISVQGNNYFDIKLNIPAGGTTPSGEQYSYTPNDCSVGDLDGDGEYEVILKWEPSNAKDNSQSGYTGNTIIDAYKLSGTQLWRIDFGKNIRSGAHYCQFMVYDFDGDGKAEMIAKTADGTKDGKGRIIGNASADYRNSSGYILSGPEYLTLFDGQTGSALDTIDYEPGRGNVSSWGDKYGNRVDRFLATVAYLDGKTPSVVMCRGYYTRAVLVAYDVRNKKLSKRWTFDSNSNTAYEGQGAHWIATADADMDGFDEIIYGAATIDHNGTGKYSTKQNHGDALHVGKFIANSSGIQVWQVFETSPYGGALRDASNGNTIFRKSASKDTGRGCAGNFVAGNGCAEFAQAGDSILYDSNGQKVANWSDLSRNAMNFKVLWDADLEDEALDRTYIDDFYNGRILNASGVMSCNGTKATPSLCADILGDWREEVIWPTSDSRALRVYTTTDVTSYRIATLMHDTQYRCQVAAQNVAYNQPAHTSFFLGTGYDLPKQPNVYSVGTINNGGSDIAPTSNPYVSDKIDEGWYYLKNVNAQKYLQVSNNTGADGQNVELWTGTGSAGQKWYVRTNEEGYVTLTSALGEYALDVAMDKDEDGTNIQIYSGWYGRSQQFALTSTGSANTYFVTTKTSGGTKALDAYNHGKTNGTNICQWSLLGNPNQQWVFEKIKGAESTPTPTPTVIPTSIPTAAPTAIPTSIPTATPTPTKELSGLPSGVTCTYSVVSDWGGSYQAQIVLKNNSNRTLNGWNLNFNYANKITNLWGAELVGQSGAKTTVKNPSWDANLTSGNSITISFIASGSSSVTPTDYSLN